MNNLYKRIVTMGMISFSAALAWIYCILAYKDKTAYVVILSLVLVISLYALISAIVSLHLTKQEDLKKHISDTVNATLAAMVPDPVEKQAELDRAIDAERLAKATYVQLRKVNSNITTLAEANNYNSVKSIDNYTALTLSMKDAVAESLSKTAKIMVKYNKVDNQNITQALDELAGKMQGVVTALDEINAHMDSINLDNVSIIAQSHQKTAFEDTVMDDVLPDSIDVLSITANELQEETAPDISRDEEKSVINSFFSEFETKSEENVEPEISENPNKQLSQDEIAALFNQTSSATEVEDLKLEQNIESEIPENPNKQLSADEIAALFNASKEERTAKSIEDFAKDNIPEAMDQSLIDAMLGTLDTGDGESETEDKIIPFPANEESESTTDTAPAAEETDPNKQLSADEIAALFASINGTN